MDSVPKTKHSFREQLSYSHSMANAPWWEEVYRRAFGTIASMTDIREDGWCQRSGVDRIVILESGKIIKVDEKVAKSIYPTFPIEQWSSLEDRRDGWVKKPMDTDFIAYAEAPTGMVWMWPVLALQRAWREYGRQWVSRYGHKKVPNYNYTTIIVPVPKMELMSAIRDALVVHYEPMGSYVYSAKAQEA